MRGVIIHWVEGSPEVETKQEVIKLQGREDAILSARDGSTQTNTELQGIWNQS